MMLAAVLLGLLSVGWCAPVNECDSLIKPVQKSKDEMLGRWMYIGATSDLPGSRSLNHFLTSAWLDVTATGQNNTLTILQTQRVYGQCLGIKYNVTFENSMILIEHPFYLKEVYLQMDCSDCLVVLEDVAFDNDTYTSLMLFSRSQTVQPSLVEKFQRQAKCLKMQSPIMINTNNTICPEPTSTLEGLDALNMLLRNKMLYQVAKLLDSIFDIFIN